MVTIWPGASARSPEQREPCWEPNALPRTLLLGSVWVAHARKQRTRAGLCRGRQRTSIHVSSTSIYRRTSVAAARDTSGHCGCRLLLCLSLLLLLPRLVRGSLRSGGQSNGRHRDLPTANLFFLVTLLLLVAFLLLLLVTLSLLVATTVGLAALLLDPT